MAAFDFLGIKKSVGALADRVREIHSELESLKQRRDLLLVTPCTREDVIKELQSRVDFFAESYSEDRLMPFIAPYINGNIRDISSTNQPMGFLLAGFGNSPSNIFAGLCGLMPAEMKASLERAVRTSKWPDGAIPQDQREKELAKLDKEISKLETEDQKLRVEAAELGLIINVGVGE